MLEETAVVEAQPEVETAEEQPTTEPVVEETTKPTEEAVETVRDLSSLSVKFLSEEKKLGDYSDEEIIANFQKGLNNDRLMEKINNLESNPGLKFVQKQAEKYNMSVEDYLDAVAKEETNAEIAKIAEAEGVTTQVAEKLYKAAKLEEKTIADAKTAKDKAKQDEYMTEFVKQYPDVKEVSQEVWDRFSKGGISLVDAYEQSTMKSELQSLRDELAKYKAQEEVTNKNAENAEASTGSVTGNGSSEQYYTKAQVDKMSREDIAKNYSKVIESQKHWRK